MPSPLALDEIDHRILDLLEQDGRRTVADIASHVSLSPAPVSRRIDRLEAQGVITGYTAIVDRSRVGRSLEAYIELRFAGDTDVDEIVAAARSTPEVEEISTIAGDPDALMRVRVDGVEHLQQVVVGLRRTGRVTGTKTLMVLRTYPLRSTVRGGR